ncbi:putative metal-binding motif-containing protein [Candidatus Woesearchaeota archaeon]|nr:putative metal-binding motif-containing protein [Candidatus Woesearchaeota archaeon]
MKKRMISLLVLIVLASSVYGGDFAPISDVLSVNEVSVFNKENPAVVFGNGYCLFVWDSYSQDGSNKGIYARRCDSFGMPLGEEFLVNTYTSNVQENPTVAFGNEIYFVVWEGKGSDDSYGVFGQLLNSDGSKLGSEFRVNSYRTNIQKNPSIAYAHDNFMVIWEGEGLEDNYGVYGQIYTVDDNDGVMALGNQFLINTKIEEGEGNPDASAYRLNYVVVWDGPDGSGKGVYGQRYDSSGHTLLDEFLVNDNTHLNQRNPAIATSRYGEFIIVWENQSGVNSEIIGNRYSITGPLLWSMQIHRNTAGTKTLPKIAVNEDYLVVVWQNNSDIAGRIFNPDGTAYSDEFLIAENGQKPSVELYQDKFITTWQAPSTELKSRTYYIGTVTDADNDGSNSFFDCNDNDNAIHPGIAENLVHDNCDDGKDNDCDSQIDVCGDDYFMSIVDNILTNYIVNQVHRGNKEKLITDFKNPLKLFLGIE